jgi:hypothetical protein
VAAGSDQPDPARPRRPLGRGRAVRAALRRPVPRASAARARQRRVHGRVRGGEGARGRRRRDADAPHARPDPDRDLLGLRRDAEPVRAGSTTRSRYASPTSADRAGSRSRGCSRS